MGATPREHYSARSPLARTPKASGDMAEDPQPETLEPLVEDPCIERDDTETRQASLRGRAAAILLTTVLIVGVAVVLVGSMPAGPNRVQQENYATGLQTFYAALNVDPDRVQKASVMNMSIEGLPEENQAAARQLRTINRILGRTTIIHHHDGPPPMSETTIIHHEHHGHDGMSMHEWHEHVNDQVRDLRTASCTVDISNSIYYLERAALAITAATASCKDGPEASRHVQVACAADISAVVASVFFVMETISEAVLMCAQTVTNMQARCSAGVNGIIGNLARISTQASFVAANCNGAMAMDRPIGDSVWQMARRLQGPNSINPTYDERGTEIATCALDSSQAAMYLANFGIFIDGATKACGRSKYPTGLLHPHNRDAHRVQCAMNVFDLLEGLFMASSFVASAITHCAPATNQQALCASGSAGLAGSFSGLLKSIMNVDGACDSSPLNKLNPKYVATRKATVWNDTPGRRRKFHLFGLR